MKKIVSNGLIVSTQLIVGALFLFMLFSDGDENNKVVVVENNNLNKMADAVTELFIEEEVPKATMVVEDKEEELLDAKEAAKRAEEEAAKKKALEEEAAKKKAAEEAKKKEEEEARKAEEAKKAASVSPSSGNNAYNLSDNDFNVVAGVIACEATGYDDALGVASVILNRVDSGSYPNTPLGVVSAPGQFSCYGYYLNNPGRYASKRSSYADNALRTALSGTRNNSFYSFNYYCAEGYSCTQIGVNGNYYY